MTSDMAMLVLRAAGSFALVGVLLWLMDRLGRGRLGTSLGSRAGTSGATTGVGWGPAGGSSSSSKAPRSRAAGSSWYSISRISRSLSSNSRLIRSLSSSFTGISGSERLGLHSQDTG